MREIAIWTTGSRLDAETRKAPGGPDIAGTVTHAFSCTRVLDGEAQIVGARDNRSLYEF